MKKANIFFGIREINSCASGECECRHNCHIGCGLCKYAEPGVCQEGDVMYCIGQ